MRVLRVVMHSPTEATVYLRPSWFARLLFSAKDLACEMQFRGVKRGKTGILDEDVAWRSKHTGRPVTHMPYGIMIEHALECQPITGSELPAACIHNPQEWGA